MEAPVEEREDRKSRANSRNHGGFLNNWEQSVAYSLWEQPSDWFDWLFCVGYSKIASYFTALSSSLFHLLQT